MMIDRDAVHLALRNRARGLVIATTGIAALSATATGYARSVGSFYDDGFAQGMEIDASGFPLAANNATGIITFLSPTVMDVFLFAIALTNAVQTVTRSATVGDAEAAGRTITARYPTMRGWELETITPSAGIPYTEEDFVPATNVASGIPATTARMNETGLYVIRWYGIEGIGSKAIRNSTDALLRLFTPGTLLVAGANTVEIRGETAPVPAQILPQHNGWAVCTSTIPWRCRSLNTVAP